MQRKKAYRERTRGVAGSGPAPATVESKALILDDGEDAAAPESLRVCLALDLEDVQGEQDDLTDTDQTGSRY